MAKPMESLWTIEQHTIAKHEILKRYLDAWFPILSTYNQRIVYLDGFCGPGRYTGGEDGSPIIAIKRALIHFDRFPDRKITFIFIDERQDRIQHLEREIASITIPPNFSVITRVAQFEQTLSGILQDLKSKNLNLAPTFAFIDPFGFKGVPYSLIRELLSNTKTEIFINIMAEFINRFIEHPDPTTRQHIIDLFGTNQVIEMISKSDNREESLRHLYQTQLQACAKYVRHFEMRDEQGRLIYYLFFAGNHPMGFIKMKEAFWRVDPESGFHFSDATDPAQLILLSVDPTHSLIKILESHFAGKRTEVSNIQKFVEEETSYIAKQMRKALTSMELDKKIKVDILKSDGAKRTKGFPVNVIVTFE